MKTLHCNWSFLSERAGERNICQNYLPHTWTLINRSSCLKRQILNNSCLLSSSWHFEYFVYFHHCTYVEYVRPSCDSRSAASVPNPRVNHMKNPSVGSRRVQGSNLWSQNWRNVVGEQRQPVINCNGGLVRESPNMGPKHFMLVWRTVDVNWC